MITERQRETMNAQERTPLERQRIERFIAAMQQSMQVNGFSQRRLAAAMGVESGTFTKYIQGRIDPLRVGTGIQGALAASLGVTLDALLSYYEQGDFSSGVVLGDVKSWIKCEATSKDLPCLLRALQEAGERWVALDVTVPAGLTPFEWPRQELDRLGLDPALLERMGAGSEAVERLIVTGEFSDELVEGFALATGHGKGAILKAFQERTSL